MNKGHVALLIGLLVVTMSNLWAQEASPITLTWVDSQVKPLDGYLFIKTPTLPPGFSKAPIFPIGGRARLSLQADPNRACEVERIALVSEYHPLSGEDDLSYTIDPAKIPGFGGAKPRSFNVRLLKKRADVSFINDKSAGQATTAADLLASTSTPLLRLDLKEGLRETLDFSFLAFDPGLYAVHFVVDVVSAGKQYKIETTPIYIVRQ
jgi:hypothetical protein